MTYIRNTHIRSAIYFPIRTGYRLTAVSCYKHTRSNPCLFARPSYLSLCLAPSKPHIFHRLHTVSVTPAGGRARRAHSFLGCDRAILSSQTCPRHAAPVDRSSTAAAPRRLPEPHVRTCSCSMPLAPAPTRCPSTIARCASPRALSALRSPRRRCRSRGPRLHDWPRREAWPPPPPREAWPPPSPHCQRGPLAGTRPP